MQGRRRPGWCGHLHLRRRGVLQHEKEQEAKAFFQQHPFPGTERNQKEVLESISSCVELRDQQQANLSAWLKQQGSATNASTGSSGGHSNSGATMR